MTSHPLEPTADLGYPGVPLLVTAIASVDQAVEAVSCGADIIDLGLAGPHEIAAFRARLPGTPFCAAHPQAVLTRQPNVRSAQARLLCPDLATARASQLPADCVVVLAGPGCIQAVRQAGYAVMFDADQALEPHPATCDASAVADVSAAAGQAAASAGRHQAQPATGQSPPNAHHGHAQPPTRQAIPNTSTSEAQPPEGQAASAGRAHAQPTPGQAVNAGRNSAEPTADQASTHTQASQSRPATGQAAANANQAKAVVPAERPAEDQADPAALAAAAALATWLGAELIWTTHPLPVRRGIDMAATIRGLLPPARTVRGLA